MNRSIASAARRLTDAVEEFGALLVLGARCAVAPLRRSFEWRESLRQAYRFGVGSIGVLGTTAALVGGIMVIQAGIYVRRFGVQELVGWFAGFGVLRDVGPLVAGLVFSGRVGSRNAAEIASMATREQLEGLRSIGVDRISAVVAPRALAMQGSLLALYAIGSAISILAAAGCAHVLLGIDTAQFSRSLLARTDVADVASGLLKSLVFAQAIAVVSCRAGLTATGGAVAVGDAAKHAVVRSAMWIVVLDLAVSRVL